MQTEFNSLINFCTTTLNVVNTFQKLANGDLSENTGAAENTTLDCNCPCLVTRIHVSEN